MELAAELQGLGRGRIWSICRRPFLVCSKPDLGVPKPYLCVVKP